MVHCTHFSANPHPLAAADTRRCGRVLGAAAFALAFAAVDSQLRRSGFGIGTESGFI
jgi:hypothetical protein